MEEKIRQAIFILTGLIPKEDITENRYCIKLGTREPIEIGFDKRRKMLTEKQLSFSSHVKLLEELAKFMQSPDFEDWIRFELK